MNLTDQTLVEKYLHSLNNEIELVDFWASLAGVSGDYTDNGRNRLDRERIKKELIFGDIFASSPSFWLLEDETSKWLMEDGTSNWTL